MLQVYPLRYRHSTNRYGACDVSNQLYDSSEQAGRASILMGTMGITEGAIPFAAGDPIRVILDYDWHCHNAAAALIGVESYAAWGA